MSALRIPHSECQAHTLGHIREKYQVAIVHGTLIDRHHIILLPDIDKVAQSLVVLCDTENAFLRLVERYGIETAFWLPVKASAKDAFSCVLQVTASLPPRCLTSIDCAVATRVAIPHRGRSGNVRRSSMASTLLPDSTATHWVLLLSKFKTNFDLQVGCCGSAILVEAAVAEVNSCLDVSRESIQQRGHKEPVTIDVPDDVSFRTDRKIRVLDPKKLVAKHLVERALPCLQALRGVLKDGDNFSKTALELLDDLKLCVRGAGRLHLWAHVLSDLLDVYFLYVEKAASVSDGAGNLGSGIPRNISLSGDLDDGQIALRIGSRDARATAFGGEDVSDSINLTYSPLGSRSMDSLQRLSTEANRASVGNGNLSLSPSNTNLSSREMDYFLAIQNVFLEMVDAIEKSMWEAAVKLHV